MYRDGAVPILVPGVCRPLCAQIVDVAAVSLQAAATQVGEEVGLDARECLHACSVETEGVVGADNGMPSIVRAASWTLPTAAWAMRRRGDGFPGGW